MCAALRFDFFQLPAVFHVVGNLGLETLRWKVAEEHRGGSAAWSLARLEKRRLWGTLPARTPGAKLRGRHGAGSAPFSPQA